MRTRLSINRLRAAYRATQRMAWATVMHRWGALSLLFGSERAVVMGNSERRQSPHVGGGGASRALLGATLTPTLVQRLVVSVAARTQRDGSANAAGGGSGGGVAADAGPGAAHYTCKRRAMAREGLEPDSRSLRPLRVGEVVAGLELKRDRHGTARLRFVYATAPMQGVQGWVALSAQLPNGPTAEQLAEAQAERQQRAAQHAQELQQKIEAEEQRWARERELLMKQVVGAKKVIGGDYEAMVARLTQAERELLLREKAHDAAMDLLRDSTVDSGADSSPGTADSLAPSELAKGHAEASELLRIQESVALNVEGDLIVPLPGAMPVAGDDRWALRAQRRRQLRLSAARRLSLALIRYRNTLRCELCHSRGRRPALGAALICVMCARM
jgi:hypothetical protein